MSVMAILIGHCKYFSDAQFDAKHTKCLHKQIARTHAVRCLSQLAIFVIDSFDISPLNRTYERGNSAVPAKEGKRQRVNSGFFQEQIDRKLPFTHEPLGLIEDNREPLANVLKIEQNQFVVNGKTYRPSHLLKRSIMILDARETSPCVPAAALIRPNDCSNRL